MALPDYDANTILVEAAKLPPEEAIAFFRAKGFKIDWDWRDTLANANNKVFQVAKATNLDVLTDIRNAVDKAIAKGDTFATFQKGLQPLLKKRGWTGIKKIVNPLTGKVEKVVLGTPHRLKTIYNTNVQSAYMAGRWEVQERNADILPFLKLIEVLDSVTRQSHRRMSGTIAPVGDPIWDIWYPPNGFNCRGRVQQIDQEQAEAEGIGATSDKLPDEGFDGNPGRKDFKPRKEAYDPALWRRAQKMKPLPLPELKLPAKEIDDILKKLQSKKAPVVGEKSRLAALKKVLKKPFTPAANLKEANEFTKLMGYDLEYKGNRKNVVNNINAGIFHLHKAKIPRPKKIIASKSRSGIAGWFTRSRPDSIFLSPSVFNKKAIDFKNNQKIKGPKGFKFSSTAEIEHTIVHETGHLNHWAKNPKVYATFDGLGGVLSESQRKLTIKHVSSYATTNKKEFVAEVYAGLNLGRKFPKSIMDLYKLFEGPL